jgi:glycopeptide antibiotics resistance protein
LSFIRKFTDAIFDEVRAILREYAHETEAALKKRLKRLVLMGIITSILVSLIISMLGTADLFLTIGELKYLSTMMPAWKAWDIMGVTSGVSGAVLFLVLYLIIRKQFSSS